MWPRLRRGGVANSGFFFGDVNWSSVVIGAGFFKEKKKEKRKEEREREEGGRVLYGVV